MAFTLDDIMGAVNTTTKPAASGGEWFKAADLEGVPFAIKAIAKSKSKAYGTEQIVFTIETEDRTANLGMSVTEQRENMLKVAKQLITATASEPMTLVKEPTKRSYTWLFKPYAEIA